MFNIFKKPIPEYVLSVAREARKEDERRREKSEELLREKSKEFYDEQRRSLDEERNNQRNVAKHSFLMHCNVARPGKYVEWLVGYVSKGGKITHVYDYEIGSWVFLSLKKDAKITKLYGPSSVNIIVPKGINCDITEDIGHNKVFLMDGFKQTGIGAPLFNDILI